MVLLLNAPVLALAEGKSTSVSLFGLLGGRQAIGMSQSTIEDIKPAMFSNYKNPPTIWADFDFGMPLAFHVGVRETLDQNAVVNFYGTTEKKSEIYLTNFDAGVKIVLPIPVLQPWGGAGLVGGFLAVTDPTDRKNHNWLAAFDNETKAVRGTYWHAGIDLVFSNGAGFRFAYQEDKFETDKFSYFNGTKVEMTHKRYSIGLFAPLGGSK